MSTYPILDLAYLSDYLTTTAFRINYQTPVGNDKKTKTAPQLCRASITTASNSNTVTFSGSDDTYGPDIALSTDGVSVDGSLASKNLITTTLYVDSIQSNSQTSSIAITGTSSDQFNIGTGITLVNNNGSLDIKNGINSDFANLTCANLTVKGVTTTINSETMTIADNIITLNSNMTTGTPTENAGLEVLRGSSPKAIVYWNEAEDKWHCGIEGSEYQIVDTNSTQILTNKTITGTFTGDVTGNLNGTAAYANSSAYATKATYASSGQDIVDLNTAQTLTNKTITGYFIGNLSGNATTATTASQAYYADYAEYYTFAIKPSIGTVVTPSDDDFELCICDKECSGSVIGVVSHIPGFIINAKDKDNPNAAAIAVVGKTPVRIVGPIKKGQAIVSAEDGAARAITTESELVFKIGIALETNLDFSEKLVMCSIK